MKLTIFLSILLLLVATALSGPFHLDYAIQESQQSTTTTTSVTSTQVSTSPSLEQRAIFMEQKVDDLHERYQRIHSMLRQRMRRD